MKCIIYFSLALAVCFGFAPKKETVVKPVPTGLKAVLVVGHQEDGTKDAMKGMDELGDFFTSKGVSVQKFYDDKADWEKIKTAATGAHFFVYSGHGTRQGEGGKVGGLCLTNTISAKTMSENLKLAKNAVVIFKSVCYGAGGSASDNSDIGITEAANRVTDYSWPFLQSGAACYYANNMGSGCIKFLRNFFDGKTLKECFEISAETWCKIEYNKTYKHDAAKKIAVASKDWGGTSIVTTYINGVKSVKEVPAHKDYDIAYVGLESFTLANVGK